MVEGAGSWVLPKGQSGRSAGCDLCRCLNSRPCSAASVPGAWIRTRFIEQHGFSKMQRRLGESLLAAQRPADVYDLLDELGHSAKKSAGLAKESLDAVSVATALNRLAKLEADPSAPRFQSLIKQSCSVISHMDARGLANAAWGFTAVALFGRPLVSLTSARVPCREPSPQGLSTSAWTLASLVFQGRLLQDATGVAAQLKVNQFK